MIFKSLEENGAKIYILGRRKEVLDKVAKEEAVRLHLMQAGAIAIESASAARH